MNGCERSQSALPWYILFGALNEGVHFILALALGFKIPRDGGLLDGLTRVMLGQHVIIVDESMFLRHIGWVVSVFLAVVAYRCNRKHIAKAAAITAVEAAWGDIMQLALLPNMYAPENLDLPVMYRRK